MRLGVESTCASATQAPGPATPRPRCLIYRFVAQRNRPGVAVVVRASSPEGKNLGNSGNASKKGKALDEAVRSAAAAWSKLDTQQRVYTVVAAAALLAAAPQLLTFLVIALERLLVGGLLAVEELLAATLLYSTRLVVVVGSVALVAIGVYLFLFRKEPRT